MSRHVYNIAPETPATEPKPVKKRSRRARRLLTAFAVVGLTLTTIGVVVKNKIAEPTRLRLQSAVNELSLRGMSSQDHATFTPISDDLVKWLNDNVSSAITLSDVVQKKGFLQAGGQDIAVTINDKPATVHVELAALELISELGNHEQCYVQGWIRRPLGLPVLVTIPERPEGSFYACLKIGLFGTQFGPLQTRAPWKLNLYHNGIENFAAKMVREQLDKMPEPVRTSIETNLKKTLPALFTQPTAPKPPPAPALHLR